MLTAPHEGHGLYLLSFSMHGMGLWVDWQAPGSSSVLSCPGSLGHALLPVIESALEVSHAAHLPQAVLLLEHSMARNSLLPGIHMRVLNAPSAWSEGQAGGLKGA